MPSPRTKPKPLSDTDIQQIATDIEGGRPPMVWFTAAAVGVPEGRSGKVVALGDPADGDFLQVRPTGSKDVLSFSPTEVTLTKPPRAVTPAPKTTAQPKSTTRKESTVTQPSIVTNAATPSTPSSVVTPPVTVKPVAETSDPAAKAPVAKPAPTGPAATKPAAKAPAARKTKAPEVTVTLTGTADGEWAVDVVNGKKRTIRGLPVSSAAVAQAAKVLHPEVAEVVAGILEAARGVQQAKVAQLQAELEEARKLLEELSE